MKRSARLLLAFLLVGCIGAAETLVITVSNTKPSGPAQSGNANAVAMWITDAANTARVKTFGRWVGSSTSPGKNNGWQGLTWWRHFTGGSGDVDGFMGATRGSYGPVVSLGGTGAPPSGTKPSWDMSQKSGGTAPDATYTVWFETATDNNPPLNGGASATSVNRYNFTFVKDGNPSNGTISGSGYSGSWDYSGRPPTITVQPMDQSVVVPATATFSVLSTGPGAITGYQWQVSTDGGSTWSNLMVGGGATTTAYTTPATIAGDNGKRYRCLVGNAVGTTTSSAATLTISSGSTAPAVTTQPSPVTANPGDTPSFTIAASGTSPLAYQWQVSTDGGGTWADVSGGTGATTVHYVLGAVATGDSGKRFRCLVSNGTPPDATSSSALLTVRSPPSVTTQPIDRTVTMPATATFTVAASGTAPLTYQWQVSTDGGGTWGGVSGGTGGTTASYTTAATVLADSGKRYRCVVNNTTATPATSNAAMLTVQSLPAMTSQPSSVSVASGATATFTVAASGTPTPSCQWQVSTDGGSTWGNVSSGTGGASTSYTTATLTTAEDGDAFRCVATNAAGSATSAAATLTVTSGIVAPSIVSSPANVTVNAGQTATFTVVAAGTAPLYYQWLLSTDNGATWGNVAGGSGANTASYTTVPAIPGNNMNGARFRCHVSNASPTSVDSAAAVLTVNNPVPGVAYVDFRTASAGGTYSPNNILAVWIETAGGSFVRTIGDWSSVRRPYLMRWLNQSGGSDTDGMMGATRVTHGPVYNLRWDLKARGSTVLVPDGDYVVWFEMVDSNSASGPANTSSGPGVWMAAVPFTVSSGMVLDAGPVDAGGISQIAVRSTTVAVPGTPLATSAPTSHCGGSALYALLLLGSLWVLGRRQARPGV